MLTLTQKYDLELFEPSIEMHMHSPVAPPRVNTVSEKFGIGYGPRSGRFVLMHIFGPRPH
jgi:hypothetical protein